MTGLLPLAGTEIKIGEHIERQFLGLTFNMDTIWTTLLAVCVMQVSGPTPALLHYS